MITKRFQFGTQPTNRITQHLPPKPRGWVMKLLFGDPANCSDDCLCEECRRQWVLEQIELFDGDYCRDCLLPGSKCRCQSADA